MQGNWLSDIQFFESLNVTDVKVVKSISNLQAAKIELITTIEIKVSYELKADCVCCLLLNINQKRETKTISSSGIVLKLTVSQPNDVCSTPDNNEHSAAVPNTKKSFTP